MLTRRENLIRVFRHEVPEWIPIAGHVDPYNQPNRAGMDPDLARRLGGGLDSAVHWCDESTITFSRYLGLDIMDYVGPPLRSTRGNVTCESVQSDHDTINIWHTPRGDLREVHRRCRNDGTSYLLEHLVKGPQDLPALAAIFEDEHLELDLAAAESIRKRKELIGDDGMLMTFMPGTPMGMMYRVYSGVAALAYLWADAPAALHDLFAVMEQNYRQQFSIAAQSDTDALVTMDDTSTTVISPAMFEEFNLGYTDRLAEIAHGAGKLYFHHSCGLIRDLLPLYRRTKMDAVHAFTIPPIGNVTVRDGRRRLGDGITIIAGLVQLFGSMDGTAWKDGIREMFEGAAPGDHFILGLAADPEKTMEQTRLLLDECRKYQQLRRSCQL